MNGVIDLLGSLDELVECPAPQLLGELVRLCPRNVQLLLVDAEPGQPMEYQDLRSARSNAGKPCTPETLAFLLASPDYPHKPDITEFNQSTQFNASGSVWLLPIGEGLRQQRWIIALDPSSVWEQTAVEQFFYLQGWVFSQQKLIQTERALENANAWIQRELEEMNRLQHLLLPDADIAIPGAQVAYTYRAMKSAGGDYLDVVDLSPNEPREAHDVGAFIADVTGHGPSAAVEAAMLDALLRTYKPDDKEKAPCLVLNYVNQHFFTRKPRGSFLTAQVFRYYAAKRRLSYASAGHPPAYLKRGKQVIALDEGGIPIGVLKQNSWDCYQVEIHKGDILFIYTDVVIESKNQQGQDFGFERLRQAIIQAPNYPVQLIARVEAELQQFCDSRHLDDDLTLCAIQFG